MSENRFKSVAKPTDIPAVESEIIHFWDRTRAFERSVEGREGSERFVFYEGPPTANGKPGVHHVIARLCKDIVCRYKTMRGYQVIRKGGWDTHGLPVEIEVEKELGFTNKDDIEAYGIAKFNDKCRESVFKYEKDWVKFTKRIGYWLDMDHPYVTYKNEYIESIWWILKEFWSKGLLYEGHKIVPYCPRCETSLSSHEVSLGYQEVSDPSIFIKFKAADSDDRYLVWTTTPWTLTSNSGLAVGPGHDYVRVDHGGEKLILAEALLGVLDGDYEVLDRYKGEDLIGRRYQPLFDFFKNEENAFVVLGGDFVSLEDGTGIVHIAPAFGEDDYKLHVKEGIPIIQPVTSRGTFTDEIKPWAGQWIKDADPLIIKTLKKEGKLYKSATYTHSYPFCWRCDTPLIYYARRSWYVKTTAFKDQMIAANQKINWVPREVGDYRFGNWLENNVDWALSRERYWGTPLNIWVCGACESKHAVGSIKELREWGENIPDDDRLDLHRPQVDEYVLKCPDCTGQMHRVSEVIDAWFDSGSMPFAQYHYPFDQNQMFEHQFPADYICEGIDQSRGWFYSLLAISTFLKGESPYRSCVVTELILDKTGQKMSKTRGNVIEPWDVLNKEGADALRWYLIASSPPWLPTRFDRKGVVESSQKLLGTIRNVYSFFAMYASLDDFRLTNDAGELTTLDRWVLSRYHTIAAEVRRHMDAYEMTRAARAVQSFVLEELSNWYVRRSRRRFWKGERGPDKNAAYQTLYTVLSGTVRLLAPLVPFVSEEIYRALGAAFEAHDRDDNSVHLEDFPESDPSIIDTNLERLMDTALRVSALGRTVRNESGVKIRQPLGEMLIHDTGRRCRELQAHDEIRGIVLDELHVKRLDVIDDLQEYVSLKAVPLYPALGKRFGKNVPDVVERINELSAGSLQSFLQTGELRIEASMGQIQLGREEVSVRVEGKNPYGAWSEQGITVAVNLEIDDGLRMEGIAREIVNRLQNLRKKAGYQVSDRIEICYDGAVVVDEVFSSQGDFVRSETLALSSKRDNPGWGECAELEVDGKPIRLFIRRESN
ncbi:MAG: isoleucine--tRNA ligase [Candidatus Krumholzibacteria bacterium]|nr:isoleucine--tRNA ligase [Candidatus Krumholzibacteria bacterium]